MHLHAIQEALTCPIVTCKPPNDSKVDMQELVVTKSLENSVRKRTACRSGQKAKKTGIDIPAGTRLEYIYIQNSDIRMVTPDEFTQGFRADGRLDVSKQLATQIDEEWGGSR